MDLSSNLFRHSFSEMVSVVITVVQLITGTVEKPVTDFNSNEEESSIDAYYVSL